MGNVIPAQCPPAQGHPGFGLRLSGALTQNVFDFGVISKDGVSQSAGGERALPATSPGSAHTTERDGIICTLI